MYVKKILVLVSLYILISGGAVWAHGKNNSSPAPSPELPSHDHGKSSGSKKLSRTVGETTYNHMCSFCHGLDGNGGGKARAYLYPWARDFRKGIFKFRSTPTGSLPLDSDIFKTITRGIPGTAMPAWGSSMPEEQTWAVVEHIKTFSKRFQEEKPKASFEVKDPPDTTPKSIKNGESIYSETRCGQCHGSDLAGGGVQADNLYDIWDRRAFVYNLTDPNNYKRGFNKKDIYTILTAGMDGTPMKSYNHLTEAERWDLVAFVESKIKKELYQPARYENDLISTKIEAEEIEIDPEDPVWKNVPSKDVHMFPLSARKSYINRIKFQSIFNEDSIAFRLEWEDKTPDRTTSRVQDFRDAAAMEFALGNVLLHQHGHNEPFFGMGNREKVVNIWQWKADWQQDIETKKKLDNATKDMDLDVMIFGGEVNPVESLNPFREIPVEEMNAEGFGTLTPQHITKQNVEGKGVWKNGRWAVVFYRTLESLNKWDIKFDKKVPVLVSFAVWDGTHRDRNGRKVIAMWQRLNLP